MLQLNLKQLEAFTAVAEEESFSAAAEKLFLTQSTVSNHIAALEQMLGVVLLSRGSRRKVCLTEQGKTFYLRSRAIVQSCRELEQNYSAVRTELVLGASTVPMDCILPQLLPAFQNVQPDCRFVLKKGNSAIIHEMLRAGEIQMGFVGTVLNRAEFVYHRLCSDRLVLVTPNTAQYRALRENGTWGRGLFEQPLIVRTEGSGTQLAVDDYLSRSGYPTEQIHVVARIESNAAILSSVSGGLGNAVVSAYAARALVDSGALLQFELEPEQPTRELYLICPKKVRMDSLAKQFLEYSLRFAEKNFPSH